MSRYRTQAMWAAMMNAEIAKVLKRLHYPLEVMLTCMRWYVAYPLRHLEEMMAERDISVDQSTVHRWALKMLLPALNKIFRRSKRPVGKSWRMDETYILVRGKWKYLYRAVDKGAIPSTSCCAPSLTRPQHGGFSRRPSRSTASLTR